MIWLPQEEVGNCFLSECERICKNDDLFKVFKQNQIFRRVIGNDVLSKEIADILYSSLEDRVLVDLEKYKENDKIGSPFLYEYPTGLISPGTLYFLNILQNLQSQFGEITNFDIVEIGGGYGGQGKILIDAGVKSYCFIDVPQTLSLCQKYMEEFSHNCSYYPFPDVPEKEFDLVISNWCLSEFDKEGIEFYYNKIIRNCTNGFFMMNIWDDRKEFILDLAQKDFSHINIIPEYPKTHQNDNWALILIK